MIKKKLHIFLFRHGFCEGIPLKIPDSKKKPAVDLGCVFNTLDNRLAVNTLSHVEYTVQNGLRFFILYGGVNKVLVCFNNLYRIEKQAAAVGVLGTEIVKGECKSMYQKPSYK